MIAILITVALLQAETAAPDEGSPPESPATILIDEVRRIGGRVEALRHESFANPLDAIRVPDDVRRAVAEIRALSVLPRERLEARGRAWSDLGLGGTGSPRELLLTLAADLDDIGLDPERGRLLVSMDRLHPADFEPTDRPTDAATVLLLTGMRPDEPLVAHVLAHVLQRQRTGQELLEQTTDRLLASMAWAEGEANLTALHYLFQEIAVGEDVLSLVQDPGEVLDGSLLPSSLRRHRGPEARLAAFVYEEGFHRAVELYRAGGWQALREGMARRRTTRDLLHPELPPLESSTFPETPEPPVAGWELADVDSLGEQAIVSLVSVLTGKDSLGLIAGEGWVGDRVWRFEPPAGAAGGATVWVSRWKGPAAAADFDDAFGRTLETRFPDRRVEPGGEGVRILSTSERSFRIRRDGAEVRILVSP